MYIYIFYSKLAHEKIDLRREDCYRKMQLSAKKGQ